MKKIIYGILALSLAAWIFPVMGLMPDWGVWAWRKQLIYWTGLASFLLMSLVMLLAIRPSWLEKPLGGLDKMYQLHKWAGIWSVILAVAHYGIDLAKGPMLLVFEQGVKEHRIRTFLEVFRGSAKDLGEWSVWVFAAMILIALWQRFPYHIWRYVHKALAVFYLIIVFHSVVLAPPQWWLQLPGLLVALASIAGTWAALVSLTGNIGRSRTYQGHVLAIKEHDHGTFELTCQLPRSWSHQPGQFAFIRFEQLEGPHPFTIASADQRDGQIRFAIKALGDYTARLAKSVQMGQSVQVEGPYGCFTPNMTQGEKQVWIAAGIGVTPFIAWLEGLQERPEAAPQATLYYCVNTVEEGVFAQRLQSLCANLPSIELCIHYSQEQGYLTAEKIFSSSQNAPKVWFCGPTAFSCALRSGMRKLGLSTKDFHQEVFQMR